MVECARSMESVFAHEGGLVMTVLKKVCIGCMELAQRSLIVTGGGGGGSGLSDNICSP